MDKKSKNKKKCFSYISSSIKRYIYKSYRNKKLQNYYLLVKNLKNK